MSAVLERTDERGRFDGEGGKCPRCGNKLRPSKEPFNMTLSEHQAPMRCYSCGYKTIMNKDEL